MAPEDQVLERRLEEYWDWVAVGLFLLIALDLFTTLIAADQVGLEHEANPLMVWLFAQPIAVVVGIHLAALVLVVVFFYGLFELLRDMRPGFRRPMLRVVEVFIGFMVAVGLFVFANNLAVIVLGGSLL